MGYLETIVKHVESITGNYKKGIFVTITCSAIIAFINFGFKEATLPKQQTQIDNLVRGMSQLNSKDSAKTIQLILIKSKQDEQLEKAAEMQEMLKEMNDQLKINAYQTRTIIQQTK